MYKIVFFVPESHLEPVKTAVFNAGAGHLGHYDQCCWQTLGAGQFRPLAGSNAYVGEVNKLERLPEYRVELVCEDALIKTVIKALRFAHPYEEPAVDIWRLEDVEL